MNDEVKNNEWWYMKQVKRVNKKQFEDMVEDNTKELIDVPKYICAYDPTIKRRVIHIVINEWAISLVTRHKFRYGGWYFCQNIIQLNLMKLIMKKW